MASKSKTARSSRTHKASKVWICRKPLFDSDCLARPNSALPSRIISKIFRGTPEARVLRCGVGRQAAVWANPPRLRFVRQIFLSFPARAQAISSHGYDPGLQLPWTYRLSRNWSAGGQLASYWPTIAGKHTFTGKPTFPIDGQLTKPWDAFVEYAGDFPQRGGPRHPPHFGSAYKLALRNQIDFHVAVGLSRAAANSFVGVGYSFPFRAAR